MKERPYFRYSHAGEEIYIPSCFTTYIKEK